MREIIFRGKTKDDGMWVYGDLTTGDTIHTSPSWYEDGEMEWWGWECYDNTIGQFTGLKDKNGKEIYEGDIVKWDDNSNGEYWRFAVVEINPDIQFNCAPVGRVDNVDNSTRELFRYGNFRYKDTENHLEVIGNVHDNPELLQMENIDQ